jgi:membrane dipeptidase
MTESVPGLDRRSFISLAAGTAALAALPAALAADSTPPAAPAGAQRSADALDAEAAARWRDSLIVNALGALDNPNQPSEAPDPIGVAQRPRKRLQLDARSLEDMRASGLAAVNWTIGYVAGPDDPYEHTISDIALYDRLVRDYPDHLTKILTARDILEARRRGKTGIIFGFQNAVMIGSRLDRVDVFADFGVRVIQLTYNPANSIGDGSMAPENRGLTPFGREVVARLNDNRIMVDLSHSGEKTCLEAAQLSRQPISINHTGCRALTDLPRNKTDAELRLVAAKGGFVGIYFMPFLHPKGMATAQDVVAHIEHAVKICGEDHVGIGTDGTVTQIDDLDAYRSVLAKEVEERRKAGIAAAGEGPHSLPFVVDLRGVNQFYALAEQLRQRGHSNTRIDKILGGNFLRYAGEVWA